MYYQYKKYWYTCQYGGTFGTHYQIEAHGYRAPSGGLLSKWGRSVAYKDGPTNYYASPVSHRHVVQTGATFTIQRISTTLSVAASAFGVGVTAVTAFNTTHSESIRAGHFSGEHDIWGARDTVWGKPGMLYSY